MTEAKQVTPFTVDVFFDVMCPICYIGDTLLTKALERFEHRDEVELRYHSFQLQPQLEIGKAIPLNDMMGGKATADMMNRPVAEQGAAIGLDYQFDKVLATNTRTAHRLIQSSHQEGLQHEMVLRMFRAYFTEGADVGDHETLTDLAVEVGLNREAAAASLSSQEYDDLVTADIHLAQQIGISGVPFFIMDGKYSISGGQSPEGFLRALDRAWSEHTSQPAGAS